MTRHEPELVPEGLRYWMLWTLEDGRWCPQFGSYDRQDVVDEYRDYRDNGYSVRSLQINRVWDTTASIDRYTAILNGARKS